MLPQIYTMCHEHDIPATFFETTTALAFMFYAQQKAQVVVLETGLGGQLDATNVITSSALSVITSIGQIRAHTRILGDTIELIAQEKEGIIKQVRSSHMPHEVLRESTRELGGSDHYTPEDVVLGTCEGMSITDFDEENQRVSKAALALLQDFHPELVANLTQAEMDAGVVIRLPCRFQVVPRDDDLTVILDVTHNLPAME
jgi:dihydrofolate synthase/folylpolyglutamate synthase